MAQSETPERTTQTTNNTLNTLLDADSTLDALSDSELKATYVRVRLASEALGEFGHAEIVDWLADPCDDYLGQFAKKLGLDVSPWSQTLVEDLWTQAIDAETSDDTVLPAVRDSLKSRARECVGTPDAIVLRTMLSHYANA